MKKDAQVTFWDPARRRKDLKKEPMGDTTGDVHGVKQIARSVRHLSHNHEDMRNPSTTEMGTEGSQGFSGQPPQWNCQLGVQ